MILERLTDEKDVRRLNKKCSSKVKITRISYFVELYDVALLTLRENANQQENS